MKTSTVLLFILSAPILLHAQGRFNPATQSYSTADPVMDWPAQKNPPAVPMVAGVPCNPNTFFGVNNNFLVQELTLVGNTVTMGPVITTPYTWSVAYCENLNDTFTPTFYGSDFGSINYYRASNSWTFLPTTMDYYNDDGNGQNLYYVSSIGMFPRMVSRFDGSAFAPVYNSWPAMIGVGDLAVDAAGNVYFLTTYDSLTFVSDTLVVISPTGQVLLQLPFVFDCYNAYGAFILNDTYYIGLGSSNATNPNTLIPVTITPASATAGAPIPMPASISADLGSCNQGLPMSVATSPSPPGWNATYDPGTGLLGVTVDVPVTNATLSMVDATGREVLRVSLDGTATSLSLAALPKGVYLLRLDAGNTHGSRRILRY